VSGPPRLSNDELEAGPGHGPCPTTRRFARRLGRRAKNQALEISKARDRSGPALYKCAFSDHERHDLINEPRDRDIKPSTAAVASG
jgi:hypothetical protein